VWSSPSLPSKTAFTGKPERRTGSNRKGRPRKVPHKVSRKVPRKVPRRRKGRPRKVLRRRAPGRRPRTERPATPVWPRCGLRCVT